MTLTTTESMLVAFIIVAIPFYYYIFTQMRKRVEDLEGELSNEKTGNSKLYYRKNVNDIKDHGKKIMGFRF